MAHAKGFEHDIFISYTHQDNHPTADTKGWVDHFHEQLENWLKHRRGIADLAVWRDRKMDGSTLFDDVIKQRISASALFLVLHSRNYLTSGYCRQELEWFHAFNRDRPAGLQVGERFRVFHILLNNIPYEQWPEALGATSGFPMHDAVDSAGFGEFTSPRHAAFETQLRTIVDATEAILSEFPTAIEASEPEDTGETPVRVFIADAADHLQALRDRLVAHVADHGASVLRDVPPPFEAAEHNIALKQTLANADLSLHLLDGFPGRRLADGHSTTYPREQAMRACTENAQTVLWVPDALDLTTIDDAAHRQWLDALEHGSRSGQRYEFVRGTPDVLMNHVSLRIGELRIARQTPVAQRAVLVDTHQKDQFYAFELGRLLAERDLTVEFNQESQDPTASLVNFQQAVRRVRDLVILCGRVHQSWLHGRIKEALKIVAQQLSEETARPLENIWVLRISVDGTPPSLPPLPPLITINELDNGDAASIDPRIIAPLLNR